MPQEVRGVERQFQELEEGLMMYGGCDLVHLLNRILTG